MGIVKVAAETLKEATRRAKAPAAKLFKDYVMRVGQEEVVIRAATGNPTGITGILQHPNPRPALQKVYQETLRVLQTQFPASSIYRQSVENLTKARLEIIQKNDVTEVIEREIGSGLIEEILIQAGYEFELAQDLANKKVWEELEEKPLPDQWE